IRDFHVTGVQTCALPISVSALSRSWALTAGSFWRMTGLLLLLVILNSVVLALPVNLIQFAMLVLVTPQMFGVVNGLLTGLSYLRSEERRVGQEGRVWWRR